MDSRVHKISLKVSSTEREELNKLILSKEINLSDLIREAIKQYYSLKEFEPSYTQTASKTYENKWRLY
ncbi:ribbon-helix-helix protein, CopG family [Clostridium perfringens]|uniref:Ribbon-helix-helix protein, CopG family n=1 Tax=Clostridium perfringens TaxID=1502 RepID=A0AAW9IBD9_CLOPF|nr:ribbon-helix-helix protein, CopG family [Clostridium perfringens]MDH2473517.1 ribbon-helix-helix protein, CopG family [Clostridium perfringens]MDM0686696.1 ribbon-helix-helix protein, CopG family [Clostridium perfringens]MDM0801450.1 ribbon-helix-helix protein, CopG family [Clostridium perfringens]MDZ4982494.1 ribbon-helix-helix protein, CopG family [Clostridium perfringens]MDZ4998846.1 ribbon-helix-helix protein, CopG family [Clostridium perfringens]